MSAPRAARWSIIIDARLTRRKFYHCVVTPSVITVFRSRHFGECIEFLRAEGVKEADLLDAEPRGRDAILAATIQLGE